jgi:RNA polymerase sigma-70 factor (ECF subfamily)
MHTTRQSLLRNIRDPDNHRAWESFFDQYATPIQRYAQKLGLNTDDAADVLQETMVELIRILPNFTYDRTRGLFRNFVLTIAHRRVQSAWRRRKAHREIAMEDMEDRTLWEQKVHDPGETPDSTAEQKWREEILREALNRLAAAPGMNPRALNIFHALAIENRPVEDVARCFETNPNLVYQIKHRMTKRLRVLAKSLMEEFGELT